METSFENIWPESVPWTYWNLAELSFASGAGRANFLGLQLTNDFIFAALVGVAAIWFFATKTFNTPSFEPDEASFKVLKDVEPTELRNRSLVHRWYMYYAGTMVGIYLALTFFGRIIIDLINVIPNPAGLRVDTSAINFESPQWPITIALGMIGLVPMLKPVEAAERFIRRWAHKGAGIPVKLHQHAAQIREALDGIEDLELPELPAWIGEEIRDPREIERTALAAEQLELLVHWLVDEQAPWPEPGERAPLRAIEREELQTAQVALDEYHTLIGETDPDTPRSETENAFARRTRLVRKWNALSSTLQKSRNELVAILAVYAERDEDYERIQDKIPQLYAILNTAFERAEPSHGPEFGLGCMMLVVFPLYAAAVAVGLHPFFGPVDPTPVNVFVTASLETLKVMALLWLPVVLVMSLRYARIDEGRWKPMSLFTFRREVARQSFRVLILTLVFPVLALALLGLLWAVAIAPNPSRLQELYLYGNFPYIKVFPSLFMIPLLYGLIVLSNVEAEEAKDRIWKKLPRWGWGAIAAGLVFLSTYFHFFAWMTAFFGDTNWRLCSAEGGVAQCMRAYSALNYIVYPALAFLGVTVLMPDRNAYERKSRLKARRRRGARGFAVAATVMLAFVLASPSEASDAGEAGEAKVVKPVQKIRVGFRADAEPFSYRINRSGEARYTGFVADLCHKIFAGDRYAVEAVDVTAQNRFDKLLREPRDTAGTEEDPKLPESTGDPLAEKPLGDTDPEAIALAGGTDEMAKEALLPKTGQDEDAPDLLGSVHVLCDPVTLRYSLVSAEQIANPEKGRRTDGVFSPIVFVTGVSYMLRRGTGKNDMMTLGLVGQVSAKEVAIRLCRDDAFRLYKTDTYKTGEKGFSVGDKVYATGEGREVSIPTVLKDMCSVPETNVEDIQQMGATSGCKTAGTPPARYEICAFESHQQLIEWFCGDETTGTANRQRVYIGDQDIIEGKLAAWRRKGKDCGRGIETQKPIFTYEPYAIVVTRTDPELVAHVQRRVYEIFSNRSEAIGLFRTHFPGKSLSEPLANLFLLNGVEQHGCLLVEHEDTCPSIVSRRLPAQ